MALAIIIVITFLAILTIIYAHANENDDIKFVGWLGIVFVIIFGWLAVGMGRSERYETYKTEGDFCTSETSIVVDDYINSNLYYFNTKVDFDNITDTTTFYLKKGYNMYGTTTSSKEIYYIINNNIYKGKIR